MALIDDLTTVSTKLSDDATALEALMPGLQAQITALEAQVADLQSQVAAGLTAAQGATILAALNAVELRFRALYP